MVLLTSPIVGYLLIIHCYLPALLMYCRSKRRTAHLSLVFLRMMRENDARARCSQCQYPRSLLFRLGIGSCPSNAGERRWAMTASKCPMP